MAQTSINDRIIREKEYHDHRFADDPRQKIDRFYTAFNHTFSQYKAILSQLPPGSAVLEYGCGKGGFSFEMAGQGAIVTGIDISSVAVENASRTAYEKGLTQMRFLEMNAEHLEFEEKSFDLVCGVAILHHLNVNQAFSEISRVLKPGGKAVFIEPLKHNPFIQLYRKMTPSLRSEDETPLSMKNIKDARIFFGKILLKPFNFLTLFLMPFGRLGTNKTLLNLFHRFDAAIFMILPPLRRFAWQAILILEHPTGK